MNITRLIDGARCVAVAGWLKLCYGRRLQLHGLVLFRKRFCVRVGSLPESRGVVSIGGGTFFNDDCSIACLERVTIGEKCLFGEGVKIYDHNHVFNREGVATIDAGFTTAPVEIGDNVWIGSNSIVLKGVHIGSNSVIGAGCIVKEDVPADSLLSNDGTITKIRRH